MSKIIDITDKLSFEENPVIKIKDVELEIDASAKNLIKLMGLLSDEPSAKEVVDMCNLIFTKKAKEDLNALKLNFNDYSQVVMTAIDIAVGNNSGDNSGE